MRYLVEFANDYFEDVGAEHVEFTPTHIVFRYEDGGIAVAYLASRVLSVVPEAE